METVSILAIELGDFNVVSLTDVLWFVAGVIILTGFTTWLIRHNQPASPDPFE